MRRASMQSLWSFGSYGKFPELTVARGRRAVFTVNDGRRTGEQRGDHKGSCHVAHDGTGNSVRARQYRFAGVRRISSVLRSESGLRRTAKTARLHISTACYLRLLMGVQLYGYAGETIRLAGAA